MNCFRSIKYTSVLPPMDKGIIRSRKSNFRRNLVFIMINYFDSDQNSSSAKITDAILMVCNAWNIQRITTTVLNM